MRKNHSFSVGLFLVCISVPWLLPQDEQAQRLQRIRYCEDVPNGKAPVTQRADYTWKM
jgi:hypothetical protein